MDSDLDRDPPPNLRERAYDAFTRHLLDRDLEPGQFVSQRELVDMSGLTLGAIRELVPRLESEGLIRTIPKRGMQIAQVDLALIRDAFQFRLFLEKEAAAAFARTGSDAAMKRLRNRHEDVVKRARKQVTPELIREAQAVDWDLHYTLIDALDNKIIARAYRINMLKIRLIRQQHTRLDDALVVPVMKEHLGIIEALESRDPERAAAAIGKHINDARARALQV
jgi:DNA-binding GntR family transcriptional regulator